MAIWPLARHETRIKTWPIQLLRDHAALVLVLCLLGAILDLVGPVAKLDYLGPFPRSLIRQISHSIAALTCTVTCSVKHLIPPI